MYLLNDTRDCGNSNISALLCSPVFLPFADLFAIIKIVGERVQLHREHHLWTREIHIPSKIINVLTVQMPGCNVDHHEDRHNRFRQP